MVAFDQLAKVVHGAVLSLIKSTEPRKRKKTTNKNTRGVIIVNTNTNTNTFSIDVIHTDEGEEGEQIETERDVQSR